MSAPNLTPEAELGPRRSGPPATTRTHPAVFSLALVVVTAGIFFAALTPPIISLSIRVFGLDPEGKTIGLSTVLLIGSVLAVVSSPLFGSLSDRTRSRFGRRKPWLAAGAALMLCGGLVAGTAPSLPVLTVGWAIAQLGFSAAISNMFALIPDMVPDRFRGRVSGGIGLATSLVVLAGIAFASNNVTNPLAMMAVPGAVAFVLIAGLLLLIGKADVVAADLPVSRFTVREFLGSFVVNPAKHPNFAWNWASRFLFSISMVGMQTYATYFLIDAVGLDVQGAASHYAMVTAIGTPVSVLCFAASGWLSDKLGRRKVFVLLAAVVCAVGFSVAAISPTAAGFLVAFLILTVGQAFYLTVDVAIAAAVVPDPSQAAKAMGVYQVATTAPGLVVPILGTLILTSSAAYVPFFLCLALAAFLSAITITFVKNVR